MSFYWDNYMETISSARPENTVVVLTARGIEKMLEEGGSQAWVLDAKRARQCEYVLCVQNRGPTDDWGNATAPHHSAFMVGRLKEVVPSALEDCEKRSMLVFSEYAEIDLPNSWPGHRNPVFYGNLKDLLDLDPSELNFEPMPPREHATRSTEKGLTIAEAKDRLAKTFGVSPSDIEITIRG